MMPTRATRLHLHPSPPAKAYMNHRALSTVVLELLRGVLRARSGRWAYRTDRPPEVWLGLPLTPTPTLTLTPTPTQP